MIQSPINNFFQFHLFGMRYAIFAWISILKKLYFDITLSFILKEKVCLELSHVYEFMYLMCMSSCTSYFCYMIHFSLIL